MTAPGGTYRSLMESKDGRAFLIASAYSERCRCCGQSWGETPSRFIARPQSHGANGPYELVRFLGCGKYEVVGTSAELVQWQQGEPLFALERMTR